MNKDQTNLNLFEKEDVNVYDTLTLNTENLLDAIENEEKMEDIELNLDDLKNIEEISNNSQQNDEFNNLLEDAIGDDINKNNSNDYEKPTIEENSNIPNKIEDEIKSEPEINIKDNVDNNIKEDAIKNDTIKDEKINDDIFNLKNMMPKNYNQLSNTVENLGSNIGEFDNESYFGKVRIMAIGIGGCGSNTIGRMKEENFENIELVAIDTSRQTLLTTFAHQRLLVGTDILKGHGSGNDIEKATESFINAREDIQQLLTGVDMVFITGGIGRGTGSTGLVEVGKIAREMGILTIGFATLPKIIEADMKVVEQYYQLFMDAVDSNVIIENDKVTKVAYNLPINQAMRMADQMLIDGIRGISDLIIHPGKINLDYADIRTAFSNKGSCVMGIGYGIGQDSVVSAINDSINSDLVDFEALNSASTIIFNITCARNSIKIKEAADGTNLIYSKNSSNNIEHMLFGYSYDDSIKDRVKVTFIATGTKSIDFDDYKSQTKSTGNLFGSSSSSSIGGDLFSNAPKEGGNKPDFFN